MKTALRWTGYVLFFLVMTAVFVYLTFPTDRARRLAEAKLTELTGAEQVTIGDLSLAGLGGVTLENVTFEFAALSMPTPVPSIFVEGPPRLLQIDRLEVDASLSGIAFGGDIDVAFEAEMQGGTLKKGRFTREKDGPNVIKIGELDNVAFGSEQLFQALVGKDLVGLVSGSVDLTIPTKPGPNGGQTIDFDNVTGQLDLVIRDAKLKAPMFDTVLGRLALSDADLGEIALTVLIDRAANLEAFKKTVRRAGNDSTIIHIANATVDGEDIALQVAKNSAITLTPGRSLKDAAVNIHLSILIKDAFYDRVVKDPNDPKLTTQPNKNLRYVLQQQPLKGVIENGVFGVGITGVLGSPRVRVERSQIREGLAARKPKIDGSDVGSAPSDADADADADPEDGAAPEPVTPRPTVSRPIERPAPVRDAKTRFLERKNPVSARPVVPQNLPNGGLPPGAPPIHALQPPPIPMEPDPVPSEPDPAADGGEQPVDGEGEPHPEGGEGGTDEAPLE